MIVKYFGVEKSISVGTMKRPYIYFDVLVALNREVKNGNLMLDEESNIDDCIFTVNPNKDQVKNSNENMEQQILPLFD
jgi:hypothetical protein